MATTSLWNEKGCGSVEVKSLELKGVSTLSRRILSDGRGARGVSLPDERGYEFQTLYACFGLSGGIDLLVDLVARTPDEH